MSQWPCGRCTLNNSATAKSCAACGAARPKRATNGSQAASRQTKARSVVVQCGQCQQRLEPPVGAASFLCPFCKAVLHAPAVPAVGASPGWTCGRCTLVNGNSRSACTACGAGRGTAPPRTSGARDTTPSTSTSNSRRTTPSRATSRSRGTSASSALYNPRRSQTSSSTASQAPSVDRTMSTRKSNHPAQRASGTPSDQLLAAFDAQFAKFLRGTLAQYMQHRTAVVMAKKERRGVSKRQVDDLLDWQDACSVEVTIMKMSLNSPPQTAQSPAIKKRLTDLARVEARLKRELLKPTFFNKLKVIMTPAARDRPVSIASSSLRPSFVSRPDSGATPPSTRSSTSSILRPSQSSKPPPGRLSHPTARRSRSSSSYEPPNLQAIGRTSGQALPTTSTDSAPAQPLTATHTPPVNVKPTSTHAPHNTARSPTPSRGVEAATAAPRSSTTTAAAITDTRSSTTTTAASAGTRSTTAETTQAPDVLTLTATQPPITPQIYQAKWKALKGQQFSISLSSGVPIKDETALVAVEQALSGSHVWIMASGQKADHVQIYSYGVDVSTGAYVLAEIQLHLHKAQVSVTIKAEEASSLPAFAQLLNACLRTPNYLISPTDAPHNPTLPSTPAPPSQPTPLAVAPDS